MAVIVLLGVLLIASLLSVFVESHDYDERDRRRWWPGAPRR
jgi:hypothetical protein